MDKAVIHKISISGNALQYKDYWQVTGFVLNQFSMDKKDGFFQISTTKNRSLPRYFDDEIISNLDLIGTMELKKEEETTEKS